MGGRSIGRVRALTLCDHPHRLVHHFGLGTVGGVGQGPQPLHIGLGAVVAHGRGGHGHALHRPQGNEAIGKQTVAQPGGRRHFQVGQDAAAGRLGAGADAHHLGGHGLGQPFHRQRGRLAHSHAGGVGRRQGHFQLQLAQVHHIQHPGIHGHALAVLHQAGGHLAAQGAAQGGVGQ